MEDTAWVKSRQTIVRGATKSSVLLDCHKEGEPSEGSRRFSRVDKKVWLELGFDLATGQASSGVGLSWADSRLGSNRDLVLQWSQSYGGGWN